VAAVKPIDPHADVRTRWASIPTMPGPEAARRARLFVVSDELTREVAELLSAAGVEAVPDRIRMDPADPGRREVMALRVSAGVVPVVPGEVVLRVYPEAEGDRLVGAPLVVELPGDARETDGWVLAERVAEALAPHLA
jgi:hypothetical protein